jgi:hypothetical protein
VVEGRGMVKGVPVAGRHCRGFLTWPAAV